ncbi:MAG: hypothetical protein KGL04_04780 [Elusimicrobia bacterium]|nr:hypothetical protein [Elusimicrobiota bacterium]
MGAKRSFSAFLSLSMAAFFAGLSCRAAQAAGIEASPEESLGALNFPASAAETLGAASMNMSGLNLGGLNTSDIHEEGWTVGPGAAQVEEPAQAFPIAAQAAEAAHLQARPQAAGPAKAAKTVMGRLKAFIKSETSGASKSQGLEGQVAQGRTMFDLAAKGPAADASADGARAAAAEGSAASLEAAAPSEAESVPVAVPPSADSLKILAGTWRKVPGGGPDEMMRLIVKGDEVQLRWHAPEFAMGYDFRGINGPVEVDTPWKGYDLAPGGLVTGETATTFKDGKLVMRHIRTETHLISLPERVVTTKSLEVQGSHLVYTEEVALYRRLFFYFGPYSVRTSFNTTNIASPVSYKYSSTYERIVTAR